MSIHSRLSSDGTLLEISVGMRFDFSRHKAFRDAYRNIDPAEVSIVIDLTNTEYRDSSALGMLLVLRERAGGDKADITLLGVNDALSVILDVSHFKTLFKLR